jgi:hypothetical protein
MQGMSGMKAVDLDSCQHPHGLTSACLLVDELTPKSAPAPRFSVVPVVHASD